MPFVQKIDLVKMVSDAEESAMDARQKCLNSLYYLSSLKLGLLQGNMKTFMHDMSSIKVVNFEKPKRRSSILNTEEEEDDNAYIRDYIKLDLPRLKNLCSGAPSVENAFQQGKISAGPMALMTKEFYGADVALEETGIPISMTMDVEIRKTLNLPTFEQSTLSSDPAKANENLEKVKEYQKICQQYIEIMDELREETSLLYNCLYNMDHSWFQPVQESLHKLVGSKHSMDKRMRNLLGQKTYSPDDMELIHNTVGMAQQIQMLIETNVIDRYGNFARDVKRAVSLVQKKMGSEISLPTPAVQQSVQKLGEKLKQTDPEYAKYLKYKEEKAEKTRAAEEAARKAEEARQAEERRKAEEARRAEEAKKAEQARLLEEARRAVEAKKAEEKRKAEEAERAKLAAEQAKKAEQERLAAEKLRQAEQARLAAEQAKQAEEARKAEELRKAEEARQAEEAKKAEQQRIMEEARRAVEARQAEEKRKAEQQKIAAEQAEQARIAEEKAREAEAARKEWVAAEQARQAQAAARRTAAVNTSQAVGGQETTTPFVQPGDPVETSSQATTTPFVQPGDPVETSTQATATPFVQPGDPVETSTRASASPFVEPGGATEANTQKSGSLFVEPGGAKEANAQESGSPFVEPGGAKEDNAQESGSLFVEPGSAADTSTQAAESLFVQPGGELPGSQDIPFTPSGGGQSEPQNLPFTSSAQQPGTQAASSASGMQTAEMERDLPEDGKEADKVGKSEGNKANPLQKLKALKPDKKVAEDRKRKKKDSTEDTWGGQQDTDGKPGFSLKDIPELPRVALWGIAAVFLLLGLWKIYSVAILSAVVLIAAALVVSPLVMKYVHQLIKIGVALALFIISFAMPNQVIPIPHEPGDNLVLAVQKMINSQEADKTNPVDELNLNYLGTNMTKDKFEAKYQGYQENYKGGQGVKPEEAEKILQDFLYNKKNLFANEELIDLSNGKKDSVQYQVIHVRQPSEKKLTMFITANSKNYKITITKKKDDKIKLSKKKVK